MAVQSKTLINDVGSAVLAETVSQMNRAAGYSDVFVGEALVAGPNLFTICKFTEDVVVTAIEFGFGGLAARAFDNIGDAFAMVTGANPDGSGGIAVSSATNFGAAPANNFDTTDVWATMAALQAVCVTPGGAEGAFQVAAGDSVALQIVVNAGSAVLGAPAQPLEHITITYRPFKDSLNLRPDFSQVMKTFHSVSR